ncbi:MAG: hypothetical protein ACKO9S_00110, partial [Bacteroidota bacterium]
GTDIFELNVFDRPNGDTLGFVSLSEVLAYSEHPDSTFLPDLAELPEDSVAHYERILIPDTIRKQMLQASNIRANDRMFVYEYANNILFSYPVKDLLLVAYLSPYVYEWPYHAEDYMLGFEFSKKQLHGFTYLNEHALITLGKRHPFEQGKMRNLVWKPISAETLPASATALNATATEYQVEFTLGDVYMSNLDTLDFYTRELFINGVLSGKNLLVLHHTTGKTLIQYTYLNGESTQLAEPDYQFAGILFKNQPPVIMGFTWESFGCPIIQSIAPDKKTVVVRCDNRH